MRHCVFVVSLFVFFWGGGTNRRCDGHPLPGADQLRPAHDRRGVLAQAVRAGRAGGLAAARPAQRRHPASAQPAHAGDPQRDLVDVQPRAQGLRRLQQPVGRHLHPEHRYLLLLFFLLALGTELGGGVVTPRLPPKRNILSEMG